jgi:hypothetical protein
MSVFHTYFYWGFLIFKGLTARRLYMSLGVKGWNFASNFSFHHKTPELYVLCFVLLIGYYCGLLPWTGLFVLFNTYQQIRCKGFASRFAFDSLNIARVLVLICLFAVTTYFNVYIFSTGFSVIIHFK